MPDPFSPHDSGNSAGVDQVPPGDGGPSFPSSEDEDDGRLPAGSPASVGEPYETSRVRDFEPMWVPVVHRRVRNRIWLHALLFGLTIITTTLAGVLHWLEFIVDYGNTPIVPVGALHLILNGLWYGATIIVILGAHELGHYLACRHYQIDASPPYFLPVPPVLFLTGTLGAFIRIREPITNKRTLFDIGIAGPLAGFFFAVPALFLGIALSHVARVPADMQGWELGEPLLFQLATWLLWGQVPNGYSINMHPMAFAAWFGLLATALNLFPIGQLDGGHISYAVLKRHSTKVTFLALAALLALNVVLAVVYRTPALMLFTVLIVVMLYFFGPRHPPVLDEDVPLNRTRVVLAVVALVVFVLCFTPVPIRDL